MAQKTFREALLARLADDKIKLPEVARGSGVSLPQLRKLVARDAATTNVEDAARIAAFFGVTLDQFLGNPELSGPIEIMRLYTSLPPHLRVRMQAYAEGLLEAQEATQEQPATTYE
ncbi:helix-turn-helix domain-containing protein [Pseudoprimorskyibacter insulae]|uniref:HTH cro/C1-type domain-containing protein n=1 Tax=Pseudoprimorskyibacter insulae TaxID=1695997 RepID=A0A2R8AZ85_9RHOB|nr:helix-turn-helix transcriptional regulator [Pseudoprimorskyibacter insulae]SPF81343.1 hypothetical protein PRI8871_03166 [Pseudoprimorskyibacter insulae]